MNSDRFRIFNVKTHVLCLYWTTAAICTASELVTMPLNQVNDTHDTVYGCDDSHELQATTKQKPCQANA